MVTAAQRERQRIPTRKAATEAETKPGQWGPNREPLLPQTFSLRQAQENSTSFKVGEKVRPNETKLTAQD